MNERFLFEAGPVGATWKLDGLEAFDTEGIGEESEGETSPSRDYVRWVQQSLNQVMGLRLAVDGIMGPATRSAIRSFQQRQGLAPDGIVGPNTERALRSAGAAPAPGAASAPAPSLAAATLSSSPTKTPMPAGRSTLSRVWVFADKYWQSAAQRDYWFQIVKGLQVTDVVLVLNEIGERTFRVRRNQNGIVETAEALRGIQVDTHLMTWLYPFEKYLRDSAETLLPLCDRVKARSILFDVESNWTRQPVNHERVVAEYFDRYYGNAKCNLGVTSVASLPSAVKPLAARCHYVLPQAYSTTTFGCPDPRRCVYDPGVTQQLAHDRWGPLNKPIVMGLAAYGLRRPGNISQREAMERSLDKVTRLPAPSVHEVAYWSLKWLFNKSGAGTAERMRFVAEISQQVRAASNLGSRAPFNGSTR